MEQLLIDFVNWDLRLLGDAFFKLMLILGGTLCLLATIFGIICTIGFIVWLFTNDETDKKEE